MIESTPVKKPEPVSTGCAAGCGAKEENPEHAGWLYLQITKRWRCPTCTRALTEARSL